jgi:RNA polymerase sigma-70 factor (ECF subfamily)
MTVLAPLALRRRWLYAGIGAMAANLETLMRAYVGGDLAAFEELYAKLSPQVFAYLVSLAKSRDRADDLCQVTFLKIHRARNTWIAGAPLLPWVLAIARNAFYDELRMRERSLDSTTDTGEVPEGVAHDPLSDIAEMLDREMKTEAMASAIEQLLPLQREAIVLTKDMGMSLRDAAEALGTTETAVKLRLHRAYGALRRALRPAGAKDDKEGRE